MSSLIDSENSGGFSLLEVVVVVALISIIVSVALPNYSSFITRGNRSDGMEALVLLANAQEQYFSTNHTYADDINDLPILSLSPEGHYELSILNGSATFFRARANPDTERASKRQAGDGQFQISSTGERSWDCKNNDSFSCEWNQK